MEKILLSRGSITPTSAPLAVHDALLALTAVNHDTVLLDYGNVLMRRNYHSIDKVRLLSGGVAGSDLCHAFFVGRGMLTGAILGEEYVPTSRQILHTIKEMYQNENFGVFVIVQANVDLFNFGLAVERAEVDCETRVKLLVVDDDRSVHKERYSCGFILLTKVLGAMAERGLFFDDIYKCYQDIVRHIVTVPLSYVAAEGHRHRQSVTLDNLEGSVREVIDKKSQMDLLLHHSHPTVALINVSKSLERLTELSLVKQVIEKLRPLGVCLVRIYYGNFVSVSPGTASLTVMKVFDDKTIQYLDDQCDAPGWQHVTQFCPEITLTNEVPGLLKLHGKQEIPQKGVILERKPSSVLMKAVQFACDALISCERQLNMIDSERSNGNVGTRLKLMAESVNRKILNQKLLTYCPYVFFKKLGIITEAAIGGTMGSVYGVFFEKAAGVFGELPESDYVVSSSEWAKALTAGSEAIRSLSNPKQTETTMCYTIRCCEETINEEMENEGDYIQCFAKGVSAAEEAAEKTKAPPYRYPDAGAHAVGIWMRAVFEAVKLMNPSDEGDADA